MEFKKFFSTYSGLRKENLSYRVICGVLLVSNLLLGAALLWRKEAVVLVPPIMKQEIKVSLNKADQRYQESWALFFALLLGNITPRNITFIVEEFEKYVAPSIYHELMKDVYEQAKSIKEANLSTSFEPRDVSFDEKKQHVLVKGNVVMHGAFGKPQTVGKTFEFGIAVKDYYPQITYMDAYDVKPKEENPNGKPKNKDQANQQTN